MEIAATATTYTVRIGIYKHTHLQAVTAAFTYIGVPLEEYETGLEGALEALDAEVTALGGSLEVTFGQDATSAAEVTLPANKLFAFIHTFRTI